MNDDSTKTIMYILFIHSYRVNNHFLSEIHVSCSSVEVKILRMSFMPFLSWNKYWHMPFFDSHLEDIGFFHLRFPEFTKMQLEHFNKLKFVISLTETSQGLHNLLWPDTTMMINHLEPICDQRTKQMVVAKDYIIWHVEEKLFAARDLGGPPTTIYDSHNELWWSLAANSLSSTCHIM